MSREPERYQKTTIVFPCSQQGILLGMKKRGFGEGWWNGFGGKLEPGESYEESAKRETFEEVGIKIINPKLAANILFYFDGLMEVVSKVFITEFKDEPAESEEMRPAFFTLESLPFDTMWPGDKIWVPKVLDPAAALPLGFVVHFDSDKSFKTIEQVDSGSLERWF